MKKIGVLGGSFDPVHNGHSALAKAALSELRLEKLIVMPAYIQPFKLDSDPADAKDRVAMLRSAFNEEPRVEISTYEIEQNDISYTYNTLTALCRKYKDSEIIFIMGADSLLTLDKWFRGEDLLREFKFAVSTRPGYDDSDLYRKIDYYKEKYNADITLLLSTMLYLSATEVRCAVKTGKNINSLLNPAVIKYIREHKLYV